MSKKRQQQQEQQKAKIFVMEQCFMLALAEQDRTMFLASPELEEQWKKELLMREELKKSILPKATGVELKL